MNPPNRPRRPLTARRFLSSLTAALATVFASVLASAVPAWSIDDHLLLCEAVLTPTSDEFLEIVNPTGATVNLDDYYLSDEDDYALLPGATGAGPAPNIASADFIARFPAGSSIPPGGVLVIAFDGLGFNTTFGFQADFEIHGTDAGTPDMIPTNVGATAGLTNGGENAVLFFWDGTSDLVEDVDMVNLGAPSAANDIADKTGLAVDGPDGGTTASMYLTDGFTMPQQASAPGIGLSTKRIALESGHETGGGGNGLTGDDETTEQITVTWDSAFTAPDPGDCAVAFTPTPVLVINEYLADPDAAGGDANGDGTVSTAQDEFVEIVNDSGFSVDVSGWTLSDGVGLRHTFPGGTVIPDQCAVVVFAGGTPTGPFGNALVQTSSTGMLGLNNTGDSIILNDGVGDVASTTYGAEGGDNQSLTLDPDVTGTPPYVKHTLATGSGGSRQSPGTKIDGSSFPGCAAPSSNWVINEILADGDAGNANGDGTFDPAQEEFVEIFNNTGADVDVSGWKLGDGTSVRHTFPPGTVIPDQCGVVVFGGGTPTGDFGGVVVQTASTGQLNLDDTGDSVILNDGVVDVAIAVYGAEAGNDESVNLDPDVTGVPPYVEHSLVAGAVGLFSPGTKVDGTPFAGCPLSPLEIYAIQGSGTASPYDGQVVTTLDNVVTAVGTDRFFIQTPDARDDSDPDTSNGIMVFTGGSFVAGGVVLHVGDQVDVTGTVDEFFELTEISGSLSVTVDSSGNALPAIVDFDGATPSGAPMAVPDLERFEGMRVRVVDGLVVAPTDQFGDTCTSATGGRLFREPGILFPGLPGLPVWDGNPESFEINPDGLGGADDAYFAATPYSTEGVLTFSFGDYQILPISVAAGSAPPLPQPVRGKAPGEITVATQNVFRLFNDVSDGPGDLPSSMEYADRLDKFSRQVREVLAAPDVLAIQEVENLATLQDLADKIAVDDPSLVYTPYLVEGNDVGGIDVGFLVLDTVDALSVTQIGADVLFSFDGSLLNDRPPLVLEARYTAGTLEYDFTVVAVHQRSLSGIEDPADGNRVRMKRHEQAVWLSEWIGDWQDTHPGGRLIVAGDFNAFEFTDGYVDVMGQVKGDPADASQALIPGTDEVDPDLTDLVLTLPPEKRYSFVFGCEAQVLDHILTSATLDPDIVEVKFSRGNADAPDVFVDIPGTAVRSSDHDGMVLYLEPPRQVQLDIVGGSCPGSFDFVVSGATPFSTVALFASLNLGSFTLTTGQCPGTQLELHNPTIRRRLTTDGDGFAVFTRFLTGSECNLHFQPLDLAACQDGEVVEVDGGTARATSVFD